MQGFNEQLGRFFFRSTNLGGGVNYASPPRTLQDNEASYLMNVRTRTGNLEPAKEAASSETYDLDENIYHLYRYQGTTEYLVMLADTKAWVDATGTPVEVTPATPFTTVSSHIWDGFTMLHAGDPVAIANNAGLDKPHYWDGNIGNDFVILTNAYLARAAIGYLGRLFLGNVYDSGWLLNRVQCSDQNDITAWSGVTSGWRDLTDQGDDILKFALLPDNMLAIFRQWSTYIGFPTGLYFEPMEPRYLSGRGILAPSSCQDLGGALIFLSHDDIYMLEGGQLFPVGAKIRHELFSKADPAWLAYAWSFMDRRNKDYYLITVMQDSTQRAWIYDYEERAWTQADVTGYTSLGTWKA